MPLPHPLFCKPDREGTREASKVVLVGLVVSEIPISTRPNFDQSCQPALPRSAQRSSIWW